MHRMRNTSDLQRNNDRTSGTLAGIHRGREMNGRKYIMDIEHLKITDNQAREAINTIAKYCSQQTCRNGMPPCMGCALNKLCFGIQEDLVPANWMKWIDTEKQRGERYEHED